MKAKWPTPPAAQVQGEQPEVVGWASHDSTGYTLHVLLFTAEEEAEASPGGRVEPLMTVAQHQRIVAELIKKANRYDWLRSQQIMLPGHDFLSTGEILDQRIDDKLLAQTAADAPYAAGIADDLERSDWTPEEALRWYASGRHFDVVDGRTRIIDTGAVASNALKHASLEYLEMKGDAELAELREKVAPPAAGVPEAWQPMETAPKDGTLLRLLVKFEDHPIDDGAGPFATVGTNYRDNTGEDAWQIVGWCWEQDRFIDGVGTPVGWLPMLTAAPTPPASEQQAVVHGCDYQGRHFGATYPDAQCVNGYLWDEDSCEEPGGPLFRGGDIPCPKCNAIEHAKYIGEDVRQALGEAASDWLYRNDPEGLDWCDSRNVDALLDVLFEAVPSLQYVVAHAQPAAPCQGGDA